jgi:hypothetical protein
MQNSSLLSTLSLLLCASCGGQWHSVNDIDPGALPSAQEVHASDASLAEEWTPEELHGHRDFPATFARVWDATVQSVHAAGIGVPLSAREATVEGRIDVDELLVEVEERAPGRVCVFARFRGVSRTVGEDRAEGLLDEIARRLAR